MVQAGYFGAEEPIAENARLELTSNARATEKLLVLTEGSSDSRILRETLKVIYPHLTECISFLDHDQFSVAGGTGGLMNLLRGFAAAGVSNRVVAVFDNDTAGCVQVDKARGLPLPKNVKIIQLPPLPVADLYPTLGPMGPMEANLNGCAC
jgi:hypothetical protein